MTISTTTYRQLQQYRMSTSVVSQWRTPKVITGVNDAQLSATQVKFGTTSLRTDGVGDYIYVASSADFAWGTNDFTYEFWYFPVTQSGVTFLFDQRTVNGSMAPVLYLSGTSLIYYATANRITGTVPMTNNNWYHLAVSRVSGVTRMFVNGTQSGSSYTDTNSYITGQLNIANTYGGPGSSHPNGYFDSFVISKVGKYSTNFTSPTEAPSNNPDVVLNIRFDGTPGDKVFTEWVS